jgi:hypothetical protein
LAGQHGVELPYPRTSALLQVIQHRWRNIPI